MYTYTQIYHYHSHYLLWNVRLRILVQVYRRFRESPETSVDIDHDTWCHISQGSSHYSHSFQNLTPHYIWYISSYIAPNIYQSDFKKRNI